jgi:oligoribonuclease
MTTAPVPASPPKGKAGDRIVWVDCEMTGLDLGSDALVEVACVVTDAELRELDAGVTVVIRPPDAPFAAMPDIVREMHTASRLIEEIPHGTTLEAAEKIVLDYIRSHVAEPRKAPLAGSSVYVDRGFLARDMPDLDAYLHYRLIDVSSIKELVRRWYPRVYFSSPPKTGNHRALADARESIAELRYYREAVMVPGAGPSTDEARGIAAHHLVDHVATPPAGF